MASAYIKPRHGAIYLVVFAGLVLSACGSQPPTPDWALSTEASALKASSAYLQGQQRIATLQWQKAREAVASTGEPALAAQVELMRCAAQVASLESTPCTAYEAFAQDASPQAQAYARYLQAQHQADDIALLPAVQQKPARQLLNARAGQGAQAQTGKAATDDVQVLAEMEDPLSRLVAAAVWLRGGQASPALLQLGVDTASAQGWRRPLTAWLLLQSQAAQQAGDTATVQQLQRRLQLLQSQPAS